jgi:alanine dehydrogenase
VLRRFDAIFGNRVQTLFSCAKTIEEAVLQADVVIGAVLIPGAAAPKLVTRELISRMKPGSVVVDVAIDQGGCFETSKPTTHADPTYVVEGVVHYCVANMPGAVARTSTYALNNATLPYVLQIADKGPRKALEDNEHLLNGLNVVKGQLTCPSVGVAQGIESISLTHGLTLID